MTNHHVPKFPHTVVIVYISFTFLFPTLLRVLYRIEEGQLVSQVVWPK